MSSERSGSAGGGGALVEGGGEVASEDGEDGVRGAVFKLIWLEGAASGEDEDEARVALIWIGSAGPEDNADGVGKMVTSIRGGA